MKFGKDGGKQRQRIDHRKLSLRIPADIEEREGQKGETEAVVPFFVTHNPVLEQKHQ